MIPKDLLNNLDKIRNKLLNSGEIQTELTFQIDFLKINPYRTNLNEKSSEGVSITENVPIKI